jgi:hypothetical protein
LLCEMNMLPRSCFGVRLLLDGDGAGTRACRSGTKTKLVPPELEIGTNVPLVVSIPNLLS